MAQLYTKIKLYLGRDFETDTDVILQDDMVDGVSSPYIKEWITTDKPKPTQEQLDTFEVEATTLESNNQVDGTRRKEYGSWNDQLDEIYHDIDAWKTRLKGIKDSNPKS